MGRLSSWRLAAAVMLAAVPARAQIAPSTWTDIAEMPRPQVEAGAALVDGRLYIMGGWRDEKAPFAETMILDIAANAWSAGTPMPEVLHHQGVVAVGGRIYVVGGFGSPFAQREPSDRVWMFDPATKAWSKRAPMPSPRGAAVTAAIGTMIYVAGGERRRAPGGPPPKPGAHAIYEPIPDLLAYDTVKDEWKVLPPMKVARDHAQGGVIDGKLYVVGGRDRPVYDLTAVEEFDPAAGAWRDRAPMPTGRSGGAAAALAGRLFVFGGEGNTEAPSGVFPQAQSFDPAANAWTKYADMPLPRHSLVAVAFGDRIYLPGGAIRRGGAEVTSRGDAFQPK